MEEKRWKTETRTGYTVMLLNEKNKTKMTSCPLERVFFKFMFVVFMKTQDTRMHVHTPTDTVNEDTLLQAFEQGFSE